MGFSRNPADWEERWAIEKDRERQKNERLTRPGSGQPALRTYLIGFAMLAAVVVVVAFAFGWDAALVVGAVGVLGVLATSVSWR